MMFPNSQRHRGAECAAIVMQARALDFEVLAVQPETSRGIEMKFTNPKRDGIIVNSLAVDANFGSRRIDSGATKVPANWVRDDYAVIDTQCAARLDRSDRRFALPHDFSRRTSQRYLDRNVLG